MRFRLQCCTKFNAWHLSLATNSSIFGTSLHIVGFCWPECRSSSLRRCLCVVCLILITENSWPRVFTAKHALGSIDGTCTSLHHWIECSVWTTHHLTWHLVSDYDAALSWPKIGFGEMGIEIIWRVYISHKHHATIFQYSSFVHCVGASIDMKWGLYTSTENLSEKLWDMLFLVSWPTCLEFDTCALMELCFLQSVGASCEFSSWTRAATNKIQSPSCLLAFFFDALLLISV